MEFLCDCKPAAFQWVRDNIKSMPKHFYNDLKEMAQALSGIDLLDENARFDVLAELKGRMDQLIAGISCKGYTTSRLGRGKNWSTHGDIWMAEAFRILLLALDPRFATVENVGGFLRRDSSANGSPLLRFL